MLERKKIINILLFFSAVTNINSWRVKSAISNVVSFSSSSHLGSETKFLWSYWNPFSLSYWKKKTKFSKHFCLSPSQGVLLFALVDGSLVNIKFYYLTYLFNHLATLSSRLGKINLKKKKDPVKLYPPASFECKKGNSYFVAILS